MTAPVDRPLSRFLATCAVCRPWAEQDEGPYHREAQPDRRDVTEGCAGAPLQLGVRVARADGSPVVDGAVEVWHCDARGRYSGFPPPDPEVVVTAATAARTAYLPDETFLRGRQPTDADGMVEFRTIYPGWYPGRTVHIHVMVHADGRVLTSQLYFPEAVTDEVYAQPPYTARPDRDTTNESDDIFPTGGEPAVLDVAPSGDGLRAGVCLLLPAQADGVDRPTQLAR